MTSTVWDWRNSFKEGYDKYGEERSLGQQDTEQIPHFGSFVLGLQICENIAEFAITKR